MKKSTLYRVITTPKFRLGMPMDYLAFSLCISLMFGGVIVGKWIIGGPVALISCSFLFAIVLWLIGFLKARKDPEFFGVWFLRTFRIGNDTGSNRSYEP